MGQRPHSPVPVTHVGVAEEAILSGDRAADRGSIKLLHCCSQDEGAGLPESLSTPEDVGTQQRWGGGHKKHGGHWAIAGQRHCGSEGHLGDNKGALGIQETWLTSEIWGHGGCLGWRGGVGTWGCRGHSGDVVLRDTDW